MAEKKTAETAEATTEKTVRVKIPLDRWDDNDLFVGINGRTWLLKRGEYVDVPEYVAELLQNSEKEDMKLVEKISKTKTSK